MGRDITQCHPRLQAAASQLQELCRQQGLNMKIGECFRSKEEQDALYAQGRTEPGNIVTNAPGSSYSSMHQWGVAFDFFKNVPGHEFDDTSFFNRVGALGKSLGLEWGGDWTSPVDKPHLQLADWGSTPAKLKKLYGNFNNFRLTWEGSAVSEPWKGIGIKQCTGNSVNFRQTPGGTVIGKLNSGDLVEHDGKVSGEWIHVMLGGIVGWVSGQYLIDYVPEAFIPVGVMKGKANDINIRRTPGGDIIGQLSEGGLVEISGRVENGWRQVRTADHRIVGWMQDNLEEI